ncbi:MAG: protein-disulfide reductase, partial [Polynucleobacter sp. 16-46-70]
MKLHSFLPKLAIFLLVLSAQVFAAPDFLPPEKAFKAEATWLENSNEIELEITPAKGYYIYQESLRFQVGTEPDKLVATQASLPLGIEKFDETFQKKMQVYKQAFLL